MTREAETTALSLRRKIVVAALIVLGLFVAGVSFCNVYQTHIKKDCGPECGGPTSREGVQGGL